MKVRLSLERGWYDTTLAWVVSYEITTKDWPWSKPFTTWSTSKRFEFTWRDSEDKESAYNEATDWAVGILDTGDPSTPYIVDIGKED